MASTVTASRLCPVCGTLTDAARCPHDGTATISAGSFSRDALSYQTGDVVAGRYEIRAPLGRGGFGAVYAAEHLGTGQQVAIKMLSVDPDASSDDVVRRFHREARVTARLTAQHTVRVFDVGRADDGPLFLVMELLRGVSLERVLREVESKGGLMSEAQALDVAIPTLKSLAEAHKAGLVHRDLKPANIMLARVGDDETVVKVLDFGIAHVADSTKLTAQGKALGTPAYMSPEQVRGKTVDGRADLYSLGILLFRCVTGRLPFDNSDPFALAFMHINEPVPDPRASAPELSEGFVDSLRRALAKNPAARFADARAMRHALESVRGGAWAGTPAAALDLAAVPSSQDASAAPATTRIVTPLPGDTGAVVTPPPLPTGATPASPQPFAAADAGRELHTLALAVETAEREAVAHQAGGPPGLVEDGVKPPASTGVAAQADSATSTPSGGRWPLVAAVAGLVVVAAGLLLLGRGNDEPDVTADGPSKGSSAAATPAVEPAPRLRREPAEERGTAATDKARAAELAGKAVKEGDRGRRRALLAEAVALDPGNPAYKALLAAVPAQGADAGSAPASAAGVGASPVAASQASGGQPSGKRARKRTPRSPARRRRAAAMGASPKVLTPARRPSDGSVPTAAPKPEAKKPPPKREPKKNAETFLDL